MKKEVKNSFFKIDQVVWLSYTSKGKIIICKDKIIARKKLSKEYYYQLEKYPFTQCKNNRYWWKENEIRNQPFKCSICKKRITELEEVLRKGGYWSDLSFLICNNENCLKKYKQNIIEMQKIDCSCNDCKYFEAKKDLTDREKECIKFNKRHHVPTRYGKCLQSNKEVVADIKHPCFENDKCFTHRKD